LTSSISAKPFRKRQDNLAFCIVRRYREMQGRHARFGTLLRKAATFGGKRKLQNLKLDIVRADRNGQLVLRSMPTPNSDVIPDPEPPQIPRADWR